MTYQSPTHPSVVALKDDLIAVQQNEIDRLRDRVGSLELQLGAERGRCEFLLSILEDISTPVFTVDSDGETFRPVFGGWLRG